MTVGSPQGAQPDRHPSFAEVSKLDRQVVSPPPLWRRPPSSTAEQHAATAASSKAAGPWTTIPAPQANTWAPWIDPSQHEELTRGRTAGPHTIPRQPTPWQGEFYGFPSHHGRPWPTMVDDHGRPWPTMVDHGRPWSTMADHLAQALIRCVKKKH